MVLDLKEEGESRVAPGTWDGDGGRRELEQWRSSDVCFAQWFDEGAPKRFLTNAVAIVRNFLQV